VTATLSVHIEAPVESVFDFFRDPGNWRDAGLGVVFRNVHVNGEGVGTFYTWTARVAGVPVEGFNVFTEFLPNRRITDRSSLSFEGTWTYDFAPEGTGTRVTLRNRSGGLWRLPLLERVMDALAVSGHRPVLATLKARLEADAERVPAGTRPQDMANQDGGV
jgi:hypothetical protein